MHGYEHFALLYASQAAYILAAAFLPGYDCGDTIHLWMKADCTLAAYLHQITAIRSHEGEQIYLYQGSCGFAYHDDAVCFSMKVSQKTEVKGELCGKEVFLALSYCSVQLQ